MSFGRHQSFYLKKHWINKGIKAIDMNENTVLINKDSYKDMGLGKNMQQSLRYWLEATYIVEYNKDNKTHSLSFFGELIKKFDPSCSTDFSLALLHYYLVNQTIHEHPFSHSFYWFFKINEEHFIGKDKLKEDLVIFSEGKIATNTIQRDVDCLIQTYTNNKKKHPEDKNVALLADLNLIRKEKNYMVKSSLKINIDIALVFYFAMFENYSNFDFTIENITANIGSIFNFNRTQVIEVIELLIKLGFNISITRTNNLDYVIYNNDDNNNRELLNKLFERIFSHEN